MPVHAGDVLPTVALVIAAHNEEDVIEAKLENALLLDYPRDRLRIIVASDASSDRTDELVRAYADRGVELSVCPRGGKVNAQNVTVRGLDSEILAFSDANCQWEPDALTRLVRVFGDDEVAYVCGRLRLRTPEGTNQEGLYWRYELWLRAQRVAHALGDRRQRLDLRRAARVVRGRRPALRARPLVPVPDGQARQARRLRARTRSRARR